MNNPDIRCYEREIGKNIRGFRRRKKVLEEFRRSLKLLLEETDNPSYELLTAAFGMPEEVAQELLRSTPGLPHPLGCKQKVAIAVGCCFLAVLVGWCTFVWKSAPEQEVIIGDSSGYTGKSTSSNEALKIDETITSWDVEWNQDKGYSNYTIWVHNTNIVEIEAVVQYSDYQPPHTMKILPGESKAMTVRDAKTGIHTISFQFYDGTLSGNFQVFLSEGEKM